MKFDVKIMMCFMLSFGFSGSAWSLTGKNQKIISTELKNSERIPLDPYYIPESSQLLLTHKVKNRLTPVEVLKNLLKEQGLSGLEPIQLANKRLGLSWKSTPICNLEINIILDKHPLILGSLPSIEPGILSQEPSVEPGFKETLEWVKSYFLSEENAQAYSKEAKRCYLDDHDALIPVFDFTILMDKKSYQVLADESNIYAVNPLLFDIAGKTKVYPNNPLDPELKIFDLTFTGTDNTMTNQYFKTAPQGVARATALDHNFFFEPGSSPFAEASVFTHANQMLDYFKSLGFSWVGDGPIVIRVHDSSNGTNNAYYVPQNASGNPTPEIHISDGDGHVLKNLPYDSDVVMHELGHHIIFQTVKKASRDSESLRLHEGLADFFTFSKTKDTCLGESICPEGSIACVQIGKCLRTAENDYVFDTEAYDKIAEPHLQGQIISGFVWDLYKKGGITLPVVTSLVFEGVGLLVSDSGFYHLILALLHADEKITQGKNLCTIIDIAKDRGFTNYTKNLNCKDSSTLPLVEVGVEPPVVEKEEPKEATNTADKKANPFCGAVPGTASAEASWKTKLLFLVPLALFLVRF